MPGELRPGQVALPPHPRLSDPSAVLCGVTKTGATGIEWTCIREPHDTGGRNAGPRQGRDSDYAAQDRRHHFVRR